MTTVSLTSLNNAHSKADSYQGNTFTGLSISAADDSSATFLIPGIGKTGSTASVVSVLTEVKVVYYPNPWVSFI